MLRESGGRGGGGGDGDGNGDGSGGLQAEKRLDASDNVKFESVYGRWPFIKSSLEALSGTLEHPSTFGAIPAELTKACSIRRMPGIAASLEDLFQRDNLG